MTETKDPPPTLLWRSSLCGKTEPVEDDSTVGDSEPCSCGDLQCGATVERQDPPPARELPAIDRGWHPYLVHTQGPHSRKPMTTADLSACLASLPEAERAALLETYIKARDAQWYGATGVLGSITEPADLKAFLVELNRIGHELTQKQRERAEQAEAKLAEALAMFTKLWADDGRLEPPSNLVQEANELIARNRQLEEKSGRAIALYLELLYEVGSVIEGESRHETARRYIREREPLNRECGAASAAVGTFACPICGLESPHTHDGKRTETT